MKTPKSTRKIKRAKPRTIRSNAKLKSRPRKFQEEIVLYAENHSLPQTIEWLKTKDVEVSPSALSVFLSQSRMELQFERSAAVLKAMLAFMKKQDPSLTPENIREAGQRIFNDMAINNRDAGAWNLLQQIELKREQLELSRERFRELVKQRKPEHKGKKTGPNTGIQAETLEQIERELKLM